MKKNTIILSFTLFLFLLTTSKVSSQEVKDLFIPYYLDNGKVMTFERIGSKIEAKAIGFGYGGINQYLTVFNSKNSPIRFKADEMPKFIIKIDEYTDPFELVAVSIADKVKKSKTYRRFLKTGNGYGGGSKDISKYVLIPELKKIKGNLYEIIFKEKLESGEYAFHPIYKGIQGGNIMSASGEQRIYCFGVD